jgi:hypothetical protein
MEHWLAPREEEEVGMAVAVSVSEQTGRDRRAIGGELAPRARRREGPARRPPPTLGEVIQTVASETANHSELVAVVLHLFDTRKVRWASSPAAGRDVWLAPCTHDASAMAFD